MSSGHSAGAIRLFRQPPWRYSAVAMMLVATMPIAAAGALGEGTRSWMWKSIRWFVAACLTSPLLALVVGLGVQISRASFPEASTTTRGGSLAGGDIINANAASVGMAAKAIPRIQAAMSRISHQGS